MESIILYLKEQLSQEGEHWKKTKDKDNMRDCLALVEAINVLEDRVYGKRITDITYVL